MNAMTPQAAPELLAPATSMRAVVVDRYGGPEVVGLKQVPRPEVGPADVLVRVVAAAVNRGDVVLLTGTPYPVRLAGVGLLKPANRVPGLCVAGHVVAVGGDVTAFRPGDQVYGEGRGGGFAEYVLLPEALLAIKPRNVDFVAAASVPSAATTALQGLRDVGRVRAGHRVLIIGASGGVGSFAVQIARRLGAHVTAVCSGRNAQWVRARGADEVIDYTREDFASRDARYDVILDLIGQHSVADCRGVLAEGGTYVASDGGTDRPWFGPLPRIAWMLLSSAVKGTRMRPLAAAPSREDLQLLTTWIEAGDVVPVIDRCFPLAEAANALQHVGAGHAQGRTVLVV